MANHIKNTIEFTADESLSEIQKRKMIKEITNFIYGGTEDTDILYIDFNTIIKQPEELNIKAGTLAEPLVDKVIKESNNNPNKIKKILKENFYELFDLSNEEIELTKKYLINYINHKHIHWLTWRMHHWGTKWNAYKQKIYSFDCIEFYTAWSAPVPVVLKLSELFPDVLITLTYADEDIGNNCGTYIFSNGTIIKENILTGRKAEKFAIEFLSRG